MPFRKAISLFILSVYLTSICGYTATILLCHCPHSRHYEVCHKGCCCTACTHAQSFGDGIKADDRCKCKHSHSTEIDLYDIARQASSVAAPVVSDCILPASDDTERIFASVASRRFERRKIPLPQSPARVLRSLRAPPVSA